ncbi:hypothetical protein REPUB_Repub13aG0178500 [Reevesia pubescens]
MEKRRVSTYLMVYLVLGILVGQSKAQGIDKLICYGICFVPCIIPDDSNLFACAVDCLKKCFFPSSSTGDSMNDPQYLCKLGCAIEKCSNISTRENPAEEKVGRCVDTCLATCAKMI